MDDFLGGLGVPRPYLAYALDVLRMSSYQTGILLVLVLICVVVAAAVHDCDAWFRVCSWYDLVVVVEFGLSMELCFLVANDLMVKKGKE